MRKYAPAAALALASAAVVGMSAPSHATPAAPSTPVATAGAVQLVGWREREYVEFAPVRRYHQRRSETKIVVNVYPSQPVVGTEKVYEKVTPAYPIAEYPRAYRVVSGGCGWLREKALATDSLSLWRRWKECRAGYGW
jgi:hypothetical protein